MARSNIRNTGKSSPFLEFLKKYWYILLGLLIALPPLISYVYKSVLKMTDKITEADIQSEEAQNNVQNEYQSPTEQLSDAEKVFKKHNVKKKDAKERLMANAQAIAHHLGTQYVFNWYDYLNPRVWTENDTQAGKILKIEARNLNILADLYYSVYTASKNLKSDVLKYVDKDVLKDVRASWLKTGVPMWL